MTAQYQLTIQELNHEFVQALQKLFSGKQAAVEIRIQTDDAVLEEDFAEWRRLFALDSARQLNAIYEPDEPEYTEADVMEPNPVYQTNWHESR